MTIGVIVGILIIVFYSIGILLFILACVGLLCKFLSDRFGCVIFEVIADWTEALFENPIIGAMTEIFSHTLLKGSHGHYYHGSFGGRSGGSRGSSTGRKF